MSRGMVIENNVTDFIFKAKVTEDDFFRRVDGSGLEVARGNAGLGLCGGLGGACSSGAKPIYLGVRIFTVRIHQLETL